MFKTYFLDVLTKHYTDFRGRATRKQFWLYVLWNFLIVFIFGVLGAFDNTFSTVCTVLYYVYSLAVFLPSLAMSVRRLHDIDFSGWWVLLGLIPYLGGIVLIVFYCLPSREPNRF